MFAQQTSLFNGIEVDVLSLGDADAIVVTRWVNSFAHRILIDGGSGVHAEIVADFLLSRGYTRLWAMVCTHPHNDHACGLIKLLANKDLTISNGWMHNINKHLSAEALRRASAAYDGVKEVVENTKELAAAFASRNITPKEPFAGMVIAAWPEMRVLGPSPSYYQTVIAEFTRVRVTMPIPLPSWSRNSLAGLIDPAIPPPPTSSSLATMFPPPTRLSSLASLLPTSSSSPAIPLVPLTGALSRSSVQTEPTTQPFNNTSAILGVNVAGTKLLFTGDAGTEALSHVDADWNHLTYLGVPHHGSDGNLSQSDIERFLPKFAVISAKGDSSHPSRSIVSGLVKVGAKVGSTHQHGNLWFYSGTVPARSDYNPIEYLKGTGNPEPLIDWAKILSGTNG